MKYILITGVILILLLILHTFSQDKTTDAVKYGRITSIEYTGSSWTADLKTTYYFDDGSTLSVDGRHEVLLDKEYTITYKSHTVFQGIHELVSIQYNMEEN